MIADMISDAQMTFIVVLSLYTFVLIVLGEGIGVWKERKKFRKFLKDNKIKTVGFKSK